MSNEFKIENVVMTCPICKDRATQGMMRLWNGKEESVFEGCAVCFHRTLDENPIAKVLHTEWQRGVDQVRDYQEQIGNLGEFLIEDTDYPSRRKKISKREPGICDEARAYINELRADLDLYETEGADGIRSQRDFLLGRLKSTKLKELRGILELAIDFFPEKYQNRVAKANGRIAELIYSEKELSAEVRAPKKDRVWKEGNGV